MSRTIVGKHTTEHASISLGSYLTGFVFSVFLTLTAYALVQIHVHSGHRTFSHSFLIPALVVLAFAQFFIQIWFFLHLGSEQKPRWRLLVFGVMGSVVLILVLGTLWIMHNLSYRMTPSQQQITKYINSQDGL